VKWLLFHVPDVGLAVGLAGGLILVIQVGVGLVGPLSEVIFPSPCRLRCLRLGVSPFVWFRP
jgi:hypothetical protein